MKIYWVYIMSNKSGRLYAHNNFGNISRRRRIISIVGHIDNDMF